MASIPPMNELNAAFFDETECIAYFLNIEVLKKQERCSMCNGPVCLRRILWSCNKKTCRKAISVFADTAFSNSRIICSQTIMIAYFWLLKLEVKSISIAIGLNRGTVGIWVNTFNG